MAQASAGSSRQGRRRSGAGTVRRLPSGRWQARRCEADGTRVSLGSWRTRADAEHALVLAEADELRGERVLDSTGTVAEWVDVWLAEGAHRWKPTTMRSNRSSVRTHVVPQLGSVPIAQINRRTIFSWLDELRSDPDRSPRTVALAAITLSGVLSTAVAHGQLQANPAARLGLNQTRQREPRFLTIDEVERLADAVTHPKRNPAGHGARSVAPDSYPQYGLLVRLAAYTGLRASEATALQRRNIDLTTGVIYVVAGAPEVAGAVVLGTTKASRPGSPGGKTRSVPIPAPLLDQLRWHLATQVGADPSAPVFVSPTGAQHRHGQFYRRHFLPATRAAGLAGTTWHDLRHSYASLMIAEGIHPRALMELMGHSSITVTLGTYGHLFPGLATGPAAALGERIAGRTSAPTGHAKGTPKTAHDPDSA